MQNIDRQTALSLGIDKVEGVIVVSVQRGSPGEIAGVKAGDIINRLGSRIIFHADIDGFFLDYFVGDTVHMDVTRNRTHLELRLILQEAPAR